MRIDPLAAVDGKRIHNVRLDPQVGHDPFAGWIPFVRITVVYEGGEAMDEYVGGGFISREGAEVALDAMRPRVRKMVIGALERRGHEVGELNIST